MTIVYSLFNTPINGIVIATPTEPFSDPGQSGVLIVKPYETLIEDGQFSMEIAQSENLSIDGSPTEVVSYKWEVFENKEITNYLLPDGTIYEGVYHQHTDDLYYTGLTHDDSSILLFKSDEIVREPLIRPFFASVPDVENVPFEELIGIPINLQHVNISLHALAKLFVENDTYRNELTTQLNLKGEFDPEEIYTLGDVARYNGSSYYYVNTVNSNGETPSPDGDNEFWVLIVEKGEAGGTGANTIGYDPDIWQTLPFSDEASSRQDVRDAIEAVKNEDVVVDLDDYYTKPETVPRRNAVFEGSTKRSILQYPIPIADRPTEVATAQYVRDVFENASLNNFPKPLVYARRVKRLFVNKNTPTKVFWEEQITNDGRILDGNSNFRLPKPSVYRIESKIVSAISCGTGVFSTTANFRLYVYKTFPTREEVCSIDFKSYTATVNDDGNVGNWIVTLSGQNYIQNNFDDIYEIRFFLNGDQLRQTGHILAPYFPPPNEIEPHPYNSNNYLRIWEEAP